MPLYEIGEEDGYPFLILKLIPGGDLERHRGRLSRNPRAAVRLMAKVARTVHYAHSHGVLHRDLKPSNILLDLEGAPHVTDFGLARCIETESSLTQSGLIIGTPAYMAPEQAAGSRGELTEAVDVYGLGAVLYKVLTGRPPFQAETMYEILEQVRERMPTSLRQHNRAIDRNLDAICLKCLEKDPSARRYHSAAALSADLERWLGGIAGLRPAPEQRRADLKLVPPESKGRRLVGCCRGIGGRVRARRNRDGHDHLQLRACGRATTESRCPVGARSPEPERISTDRSRRTTPG